MSEHMICPCCKYSAHKANIGKPVAEWQKKISAKDATIKRLRGLLEEAGDYGVCLWCGAELDSSEEHTPDCRLAAELGEENDGTVT